VFAPFQSHICRPVRRRNHHVAQSLANYILLEQTAPIVWNFQLLLFDKDIMGRLIAHDEFGIVRQVLDRHGAFERIMLDHP